MVVVTDRTTSRSAAPKYLSTCLAAGRNGWSPTEQLPLLWQWVVHPVAAKTFHVQKRTAMVVLTVVGMIRR